MLIESALVLLLLGLVVIVLMNPFRISAFTLTNRDACVVLSGAEGTDYEAIKMTDPHLLEKLDQSSGQPCQLKTQ